MKTEVYDFLTAYSGYNGGDIGSPERPAIWCCGIEWGSENSTLETVKDYFNSKEWQDIQGFEEEGENAQGYYDRVVCKLLCAINGQAVENYKSFAKEQRVWMKGAKTGYFKMNLYPLWFKNTDPSLWDKRLAEFLSLKDKWEYLDWCRQHRFPKINEMARKYQPKLVIGFGLTHEKDFNLAFSDGYKPFNRQPINDKLVVRWKCNENGTFIVVLPFPNVPNSGFQRDIDIQASGEFLASLLAK